MFCLLVGAWAIVQKKEAAPLLLDVGDDALAPLSLYSAVDFPLARW